MATATTTREATMMGVLVSFLAIFAGGVREKLCCVRVVFIIYMQEARRETLRAGGKGKWNKALAHVGCSWT